MEDIGSEPEIVSEFIMNRILSGVYIEALHSLRYFKLNSTHQPLLSPYAVFYLAERFPHEPVVQGLIDGALERMPNWLRHVDQDHQLLTEDSFAVISMAPRFADMCQYKVELQCAGRCQHRFSVKLEQTIAVELFIQCPNCLGHGLLGFDDIHAYLIRTGKSEFIEDGPLMMEKIEEFLADLLEQPPHKSETDQVLEMQSVETAYYLMGICMERLLESKGRQEG